MAIFTSKIFCSRCKKAYKRKSERGKFKWCDQGYDNSLTDCPRIIIDEEAMRKFIGMRIPLKERTEETIDEFIKHKVSKIVVTEKNNFMIYITGQEEMFIKQGHIHY